MELIKLLDNSGTKCGSISTLEVLRLLEHQNKRKRPTKNPAHIVHHLEINVGPFHVPDNCLTTAEGQERLGRAIAESSADNLYSLESLTLGACQINSIDFTSETAILFEYINENRSLRHLSIEGDDFGDELSILQVLETLKEFFAENQMLETLTIEWPVVTAEEMFTLMESLSRRKGLELLQISYCGMGDKAIKRMMYYFNLYPRMIPKRLVLNDNFIGDDGCAFISDFIRGKVPSKANARKKNEENLVNLDEKEIDLGRNNVSPVGCQSIFNALASRRCRLKTLDLGGNRIEAQGINSFVEAFSNNPDVVPYNVLLYDHGMSVAGHRSLGDFLASRNSPLEKLDISGSTDEDGIDRFEAFQEFIQAFESKPSVLPKALNANFSIFWRDCFVTMATLLRHPECSLETFHALNWRVGREREASMDDEMMNRIAESLKSNERMRKFLFDTNELSDTGWNHLSRLLCDKTSFQSTYASNHTIQQLGSRPTPPFIRHYLMFNRNEDKLMAGRIKVIDAHFAKNFHLHHLGEIQPAGLLPRTLRFVQRGYTEREDFMKRQLTHSDSVEGDDDEEEMIYDVQEAEEVPSVENNCLTVHFLLVKNNLSVFFDALKSRKRKRRERMT